MIKKAPLAILTLLTVLLLSGITRIAPPYGTLSVWIVQEGRRIDMTDHVFLIRRAPFTLVFRLPASEASALIHFSLDRADTVDPLRRGERLESILGFCPGLCMADGPGNPDRDLIVRRMGLNSWFHDMADPPRSRFDRVTREGHEVIAERDIETIQVINDRGSQYREGRYELPQFPYDTIFAGVLNPVGEMRNDTEFGGSYTDGFVNWFEIRFR